MPTPGCLNYVYPRSLAISEREREAPYHCENLSLQRKRPVKQLLLALLFAWADFTLTSSGSLIKAALGYYRPTRVTGWVLQQLLSASR